jgi:hypothetical protein
MVVGYSKKSKTVVPRYGGDLGAEHLGGGKEYVNFGANETGHRSFLSGAHRPGCCRAPHSPHTPLALRGTQGGPRPRHPAWSLRDDAGIAGPDHSGWLVLSAERVPCLWASGRDPYVMSFIFSTVARLQLILQVKTA